jgi:hypothetical protein
MKEKEKKKKKKEKINTYNKQQDPDKSSVQSRAGRTGHQAPLRALSFVAGCLVGAAGS